MKTFGPRWLQVLPAAVLLGCGGAVHEGNAESNRTPSVKSTERDTQAPYSYFAPDRLPGSAWDADVWIGGSVAKDGTDEPAPATAVLERIVTTRSEHSKYKSCPALAICQQPKRWDLVVYVDYPRGPKKTHATFYPACLVGPLSQLKGKHVCQNDPSRSIDLNWSSKQIAVNYDGGHPSLRHRFLLSPQDSLEVATSHFRKPRGNSSTESGRLRGLVKKDSQHSPRWVAKIRRKLESVGIDAAHVPLSFGVSLPSATSLYLSNELDYQPELTVTGGVLPFSKDAAVPSRKANQARRPKGANAVRFDLTIRDEAGKLLEHAQSATAMRSELLPELTDLVWRKEAGDSLRLVLPSQRFTQAFLAETPKVILEMHVSWFATIPPTPQPIAPDEAKPLGKHLRHVILSQKSGDRVKKGSYKVRRTYWNDRGEIVDTNAWGQTSVSHFEGSCEKSEPSGRVSDYCLWSDAMSSLRTGEVGLFWISEAALKELSKRGREREQAVVFQLRIVEE